MTQRHIYTDGSCLGNPWPWWWAYLIIDDTQVVIENAGPLSWTTNNQMELYACIQALQCIVDHGWSQTLAICHTDSRYVQKWLTYLITWKQNGRRTSNHQPVKNQALRKCLDTLCQQCQLDRQWVKAHHQNSYNNRVDQLAYRQSYKAQSCIDQCYLLPDFLKEDQKASWLFG